MVIMYAVAEFWRLNEMCTLERATSFYFLFEALLGRLGACASSSALDALLVFSLNCLATATDVCACTTPSPFTLRERFERRGGAVTSVSQVFWKVFVAGVLRRLRVFRFFGIVTDSPECSWTNSFSRRGFSVEPQWLSWVATSSVAVVFAAATCDSVRVIVNTSSVSLLAGEFHSNTGLGGRSSELSLEQQLSGDNRHVLHQYTSIYRVKAFFRVCEGKKLKHLLIRWEEKC